MVLMVRCVRVLGRALMNSVSSNRAGRLVGSEGDIARAPVHFRHGRIRNFELHHSSFFEHCMDRVIRDVICTSAIGIMGLAAQRSNEGGLVFLHYYGGGCNITKELFGYFRGDVRYQD